MKAVRRWRLPVIGLLLVALHGGCAVTGTYEPMPFHRISQLDPASRIYTRDGRRFEPGMTGGAEDLVAGNDLAVAFARRAHRQRIAGIALYATGFAAMVTGLVLLVPPERSEGRLVAGNVLYATGLVPMLVSVGFFSASWANLQDAINIYNDALEGPIDPHAFDDHPPPGGR